MTVVVAPAMAASPKSFVHSNPEISEQNGILTLLMDLGVEDVEALRDLLKAGSVIELRIKVDVERPRTFWTNVTIAEAVFSSILRHDPLTREFTLALPGELYPSQRDRNLDRLLDASWKKLKLPVASMDKLLKEGDGQEILVLMELSLQYIELPSWLDKNLVMWSKNVVPKEDIILRYMPPYPGAIK